MRFRMKRSNTITRSLECKLNRRRVRSARSTTPPLRRYPAATASSGFRSIIHSTSLAPRNRASSAPRTQSSGGDVSAITMSGLGNVHMRSAQFNRKLAKVTARFHTAVRDSERQPIRRTSTPRHDSRAANRTSGWSYAAREVNTVTSCPASASATARSAACWAVETTSG
jgi:hypothetical protein